MTLPRLALLVVTFATLGCIERVSLEQRPCPCEPGWQCCHNVCVQDAVVCAPDDAGVQDVGPQDVGPQDVGLNDGLRPDGCPTVHVNETPSCGDPSGAWVIETVATLDPNASAQQTSLDVDGAGGLHIATSVVPDGDSAGKLVYAYRAPSSATWTTEVVPVAAGEGSSGGASLVVETGGTVDVAYSNETWGLSLARGAAGGPWAIETIDVIEGSGGASLLVAPDGSLHAAYARTMVLLDGTVGGWLKHGLRGSGGWVIDEIDSPHAGSHSALAMDGAGGLHVSYWDSENDRLNYAYRPMGDAWTVEVVDASCSRLGMFSGLALDPAGGVHIAYAEEFAYTFFYAHRAAGASTWSIEQGDTLPEMGPYSVALDSQGGVHVVQSSGLGSLRHAYRSPAGTWCGDTLDAGGTTWGASMGIAANGTVHLAYTVGGHTGESYLLKHASRAP